MALCKTFPMSEVRWQTREGLDSRRNLPLSVATMHQPSGLQETGAVHTRARVQRGHMMIENPGDLWFLAQIRPNCVHIAERNLKRQGFPIFLPREESTVRRRGRFVSALLPLFPGYIFVSLNTSAGQWRAVNSTYGVTKLVSFGTAPAPVPLDLVNQLMLRCDASGNLLPPRLLKPGDQVRITTGPFAQFVAEVEKIAPDRRVWVLMDLMGGKTRVAMLADQVSIVGT